MIFVWEKFSDKHVLANSVYPDQTALRRRQSKDKEALINVTFETDNISSVELRALTAT